MMGLDQGGGREGRGEQRADFEYFEVLLLKGWVWRKAAPSPLPGAQVLCWWGKEREVPGGRGWARRGWPAGATPPSRPHPLRLLLLHPLSLRQLQAKKRKW